MLRTKKQSEPVESPGAPEWMVTFSDCMTLLLTFFVLLLSFSSFDEQIFQRLKTTLADFPSISQVSRQAEDALSTMSQIMPTADISCGSEKPTLEAGKQDRLKAETEPVDFRNRKVFLISSEKIFWGKGTAISLQGREALATIASFLKQITSRVVISENGQPEDRRQKTEDSPSVVRPLSSVPAGIGLQRAWAVVEYLVKKQGVGKNRFSISAASTLDPDRRGQQESRMLEIVLLERSIYH
ncbi:MAG: flagellar motor protein MotB [Sedimentisphaerales bacterium]